MMLIDDGIIVIAALSLASDISDLHTAAFGFQRSLSLTEHKIREKIKDPNYGVYGYVLNGMLVGVFFLYDAGIHSSKLIESFCVAPWQKGKGIGSQMLRFILNKYMPYDFHLTVGAENDPARGLYKKFDFDDTGKLTMKRSSPCTL
jgi:ribosomal protein S18 acetylase RimI-like enzyme